MCLDQRIRFSPDLARFFCRPGQKNFVAGGKIACTRKSLKAYISIDEIVTYINLGLMKRMLPYMKNLYGKDSERQYKTFCVKRLAALFLGKVFFFSSAADAKALFFAHQEL
jgi:hypothetical protein